MKIIKEDFMSLRERFLKRGLSSRESEVAVKVLDGNSNKQIGKELYITEKTVKFHLTNIFRKFNIKSRTQLVSSSIQDIIELAEEHRANLKEDKDGSSLQQREV